LDLADEPFRDEEFEAAKDHVVAMGAAEKARGAGGGLKAPGRGRRNVTGAAPTSAQPAFAPGTTAASVLTGELRNQIDGIWNAFWSGGIANPLEVLERSRSGGLVFAVEPKLRFAGEVLEHHTLFLIDPTGNWLEFKHYSDPDAVLGCRSHTQVGDSRHG